MFIFNSFCLVVEVRSTKNEMSWEEENGVDGWSGGEEEGEGEKETGEGGVQLFTCNQCNLSFNSLALCSTHLSKHKKQSKPQDSRLQE